jgi:acyl-CoA thioesterase FadM
MSRPAPLAASVLPKAAPRILRRFAFSDCDPAGIAFYGAWFTHLNAAMESFFDDRLGISYTGMIGPRGIGLGFVHVTADWFAPARHGDVVHFTPLVTRIGGASWSTTFHMHRGERELARIACVNATTDLASARPLPLPPDLRLALARQAAACESLAA